MMTNIILIVFLIVLFPILLVYFFVFSIKKLQERKKRIKKWDNLVDVLTDRFSRGETDETKKDL